MRFLKNLPLVMMSSWRHESPYDTHHKVLINRAKFDAYTSSSSRRVKTHARTELRFIVQITAVDREM